MDSLELIRLAGIHRQIKDPDTAHLVIGLNKVISSHSVEGLAVAVDERPDGVAIRIVLAEGAVLAKPVHLCFGLLQDAGVQRIGLDLDVRRGASMNVVAHCVFPNARDVRHEMDATIRVGEGARYSYFERHIHSPAGGITVLPKARIELARGSRFKTEFELIQGRVGVIDIDYETTAGPESVMDMNARISGRGDDVIQVHETGLLCGERATGVLTSRVAVRDRARAEVYNKLVATAAYARGHVDCKEIIHGGGTAHAVPIVEVSHPKAHVTHEAALGSVDSKQLETLMARGLSEDEAADLIIAGLLS